MTPSEIHEVLASKYVRCLHHANTVQTSCSFLRAGALLSREYVESNNLTQTPQPSDQIDKQFGIWDRVFVDHVDIHDRARRRNYYGPVLFVLDISALLSLPEGATIEVTKRNPVHWYQGQSQGERWFQSPDELRAHLSFGDFDKMLVIKTPSKAMSFAGARAKIVLDNPRVAFAGGADVHKHAIRTLTNAAEEGGVQLEVFERQCRNECKCVADYAAYWNLNELFG